MTPPQADRARVVRNSIGRVSQRQWGADQAIWDADHNAATYDVDHIDVRTEAEAPDDARAYLSLDDDARVTVRSRRYKLDGKPVMLATSYLPATLVAGSKITQPDTGPGGTYARLAELGHAPAHFREDVIARIPTPDETAALELDAGTPVITITRTAVTEDGTPVEINYMTLDASAYVVRYDFDA